jgi:hypothetical protein
MYIYIHVYSKRENKIVVEGLLEGTMRGGRVKKMSENEKC